MNFLPLGGAAGTAFIHTAVNNDTRPDIQIILASFLWGLDHGLQLKHNIGMQVKITGLIELKPRGLPVLVDRYLTQIDY